MFQRPDGRAPDQLRPVRITRGYLIHVPGSALIEMGATKVICTASIDEKVPPFLQGRGVGWLTAEYGMIPCSTTTRTPREGVGGRIKGRTQEIQRLIGRSLRAIVDLSRIGERTIQIDCDVIQADGGTRTASICGAYVALREAIWRMQEGGLLTEEPVFDSVAAVSVGLVDAEPLLDLCYEEDSTADVDMNIVMTGSGEFVEVQGTAERQTFTLDDMQRMLALARRGIAELEQAQREALGLAG